jgi:hypothetical protein
MRRILEPCETARFDAVLHPYLAARKGNFAPRWYAG